MNLSLETINQALGQDAQGYIAQCDDQYTQRIEQGAEQVLARLKQSRVILLAGPSSSGKTTTANRLRQAMERRGIHCHMVSLDDYYHSKREPEYPKLPNGEPDLETPLALHTEIIRQHLTMLDRGEEILVPHFDFKQQRQIPELAQPLRLGPNEAVIFEGIHGLNPLLTQHHPQATRLYLSTETTISAHGQPLFFPMWMRFLRRLVRDFYHRGCDAQETLTLWENVQNGEQLYILPYKDSAHVAIDTAHGYEVSCLGPLAATMLAAVEHNSQPALTQGVLAAMPQFVPLDWHTLSRHSLLREEFLPED